MEIRVKKSDYREKVVYLHRDNKESTFMTTRREKSKPQKPQPNKQMEAVQAEEPK